jgi:3-hydroxyacyl-CoA dehydrogenase
METSQTSGIKNVTIIGAGILGAQIAIQATCFAFKVKVYDNAEGAFERSVQQFQAIMEARKKGPVVPIEKWNDSISKVETVSVMSQALEDADLVIEAVPENLELKRKVFQQMDELTPSGAILATNSSTIPVSRIEDATGRPEKCLNLHFYTPVTGLNMVDIMGGSRTTPETMAAGKQWLSAIGCVPLTVKKEIYGFCFNRVWRSVKRQVLYMWADGFVDHQDIDRAWMLAYGLPVGPFGQMDINGLDITYQVETSYYLESGEERDRPPDALKAMVDRGELGVKTGKGFYTYPDPEFADPDFLKG